MQEHGTLAQMACYRLHEAVTTLFDMPMPEGWPIRPRNVLPLLLNLIVHHERAEAPQTTKNRGHGPIKVQSVASAPVQSNPSSHIVQAPMRRAFPGNGQLVSRLQVVMRENAKVGAERLPGSLVSRELQALRGHLARAEMVAAA